jgi:hypothetical protein
MGRHQGGTNCCPVAIRYLGGPLVRLSFVHNRVGPKVHLSVTAVTQFKLQRWFEVSAFKLGRLETADRGLLAFFFTAFYLQGVANLSAKEGNLVPCLAWTSKMPKVISRQQKSVLFSLNSQATHPPCSVVWPNIN